MNNYIHIRYEASFSLFSCCSAIGSGKNMEYYRQNACFLNPKENQVVVDNITEESVVSLKSGMIINQMMIAQDIQMN